MIGQIMHTFLRYAHLSTSERKSTHSTRTCVIMLQAACGAYAAMLTLAQIFTPNKSQQNIACVTVPRFHFQILYQPINALHSLTLAAARGRPSISSFPSSHNHELISTSGVFNTYTPHKIYVCSIRHLVPRHNTFLPDSSRLLTV